MQAILYCITTLLISWFSPQLRSKLSACYSYDTTCIFGGVYPWVLIDVWLAERVKTQRVLHCEPCKILRAVSDPVVSYMLQKSRLLYLIICRRFDEPRFYCWTEVSRGRVVYATSQYSLLYTDHVASNFTILCYTRSYAHDSRVL
jgi:hypothetical protein